MLREILRGRDFRRLYATRLTSQLTDGVFQVALAGYVFFSPERQTSAGKAAAAFAVTLLPYSVLGPFAGVLIDRWQRRQILVWTPVTRAVLVALIAALVAAGEDGVVFFAGVLVVLGVNRFFLASLSAGLPHVVRREHLVTANAFSVTSGTVIAFVGAGLGYLLRDVSGAGDRGTALILLVAAGLYLLAGLVATLLPRRVLGPQLDEAPVQTREALGNVLHGLVDGGRHIVRRRPAALALAAISFHRFLYGIVLITTLLLCRNHFNSDPENGLATFALMLGVSGAGFFAAALVTPIVVRRISKQAWIAWLLGGGAVSLLVLGTPFAEAPWAAGAFALGVVSQGVKLCVDTILQETIDDAYRGRVFAVYDMLFNATFAAGAAVAAGWLPVDGVSYPTLGAVVVAYGIGALIYRGLTSRAATTVA
ncbi:MFS transporter [Actinomadura sp. NBRC 104412]|uniref:MFS transporter n=1 Tax=Actinomadura sp. NBRC 104412 TaxID=3032203 RepID=UPI0024A1E23B|nr:MFS transporter [Actinomadura sp. NBRC 104412]GLZ09011.1 MFS transporter [Actinomadura sp. NBRC 104412]